MSSCEKAALFLRLCLSVSLFWDYLRRPGGRLRQLSHNIDKGVGVARGGRGRRGKPATPLPASPPGSRRSGCPVAVPGLVRVPSETDAPRGDQVLQAVRPSGVRTRRGWAPPRGSRWGVGWDCLGSESHYLKTSGPHAFQESSPRGPLHLVTGHGGAVIPSPGPKSDSSEGPVVGTARDRGRGGGGSVAVPSGPPF